MQFQVRVQQEAGGKDERLAVFISEQPAVL